MESKQVNAKSLDNKDENLMVFDWEKAARLINKHGVKSASAGLSGDWKWTSGDILINGKLVEYEYSGCYLASNWARPAIEIRGVFFDCYKMQSETPGWDSHTYWPEEALAILNIETE